VQVKKEAVDEYYETHIRKALVGKVKTSIEERNVWYCCSIVIRNILTLRFFFLCDRVCK